MLVARRLLLLAALWLVFEFAISWFATCEPPSQGATNYRSEKNHCTLFSGPVALITAASFGGLFSFLHKHEKELIAGFTIVLAFSTTFLWWSTRQLWAITKIAAEHIPRVERAYLFFGPKNITHMNVKGKVVTRLELSYANHGKTPGIIKAIYFEFSNVPPIGAEPIYFHGTRRDVDYAIEAGGGGVLPEQFESSATGRQFFRGYVEYQDIFREKLRTSRFCTIIDPKIGKFDNAGSEAWRDWT